MEWDKAIKAILVISAMLLSGFTAYLAYDLIRHLFSKPELSAVDVGIIGMIVLPITTAASFAAGFTLGNKDKE